MWADRMLGNRCVCSGASRFIMVYICPRMIDPLCCLIRPRALCGETCDWKSWRRSIGLLDGRQAMEAMCGRS
jgi:hypothetical protein